jgi:hypothetical protein
LKALWQFVVVLCVRADVANLRETSPHSEYTYNVKSPKGYDISNVET